MANQNGPKLPTNRGSKEEGAIDDARATGVGFVDTAGRYGSNGKLTYEGMKEIIAEGGSFMWPDRGGRMQTISRLDDRNFPNEAQIAKGDAQAEASAAASIDAQIKRLQQTKAELSDTSRRESGAASNPTPGGRQGGLPGVGAPGIPDMTKTGQSGEPVKDVTKLHEQEQKEIESRQRDAEKAREQSRGK